MTMVTEVMVIQLMVSRVTVRALRRHQDPYDGLGVSSSRSHDVIARRLIEAERAAVRLVDHDSVWRRRWGRGLRAELVHRSAAAARWWRDQRDGSTTVPSASSDSRAVST